MKRTILFAVCLIGIIFLNTSCQSKKYAAGTVVKASNPVIAHRGAFKKNGLPENSIASLKEAFRLGCAGSEFDVRMTADDSLVINHDAAYHKLPIEKNTYASLTVFPLSNGEKIPTLREYLLAGKALGKGTRLIVEIKPSDLGKERAMRITDKVVDLVKELKLEKQVAYISFDYEMVKRVHAIDPAAHTQYLNGDKTPEELKQDGISGADYQYAVFQKNPGWVAAAHQAGIVLNAWTVNDTTNMRRLLREGFSFITTNEPELLFAELGGKR